MEGVRSRCPLCDAAYCFNRDEISVCPACSHEIRQLDPNEEAPRIESSRKINRLCTVLFFTALVLIFFFPIGTLIGFTLFFTSLAVTASLQERCGNCGVNLNQPNSPRCVTCGARLSFNVG